LETVLVVRTARFCRTCGHPRDPEVEDCPRCAARSRSLAAAGSADTGPIRSAIALYFVLLGISATCLIVMIVRGSELSVREMLYADAAFSLVTIGWCAAHRRELLPLLGTFPGVGWYLTAVLLAIPTFLIAHVLVEGMERVFGLEEYGYSTAFLAEGYGWPWIILSICVQPGIFEELGFRGVIQTSLGRVLTTREALAVSAMMFAILHLSILGLPHLFLIGVVLGALRLRTGSLYPGMLMHFTHNLLAVLSEPGGGVPPW
jgi:membrane protease YdiL (CAAX protease family)